MGYGRISWLKDELTVWQLGSVLGSRLLTDWLLRLLALSAPVESCCCGWRHPKSFQNFQHCVWKHRGVISLFPSSGQWIRRIAAISVWEVGGEREVVERLLVLSCKMWPVQLPASGSLNIGHPPFVLQSSPRSFICTELHLPLGAIGAFKPWLSLR